jgi:peptidyl-prolyl cis-trans isomerase C
MRTVVIDGVEIPEVLIAQEAQNHPGGSAAEARTAAGHALAIKALLLRRAEELGLDPEAERDAEDREETRDEALIRAVLETQLAVATPTEAECRRVYDAERRRFQTPPLYEASHILIEPRSAADDDLESARQAAERLIALLAGGGVAFADLARDHSDCPSGAIGGSLGQLQPGQVVGEVERALEGLDAGGVSPAPVRSRFGWHVLKLDRRVEGRSLPFEMVEARIRLHLESRAWTAAATRYVAELTAEARSRGVALSVAADGFGAPRVSTLGDLIADVQTAERLDAWLAAADPDLARRLAAAAQAAERSVPDFVRQAVADFVTGADDERWTQLISAAQGAEDPALACLAALLRSKIEPAKRTFTVIRRVGSPATPGPG